MITQSIPVDYPGSHLDVTNDHVFGEPKEYPVTLRVTEEGSYCEIPLDRNQAKLLIKTLKEFLKND